MIYTLQIYYCAYFQSTVTAGSPFYTHIYIFFTYHIISVLYSYLYHVHPQNRATVGSLCYTNIFLCYFQYTATA